MTSHDDSIDDSNSVAIIGIAGRFPGADDLDTFWSNLRDGVESVARISDEDLRRIGVDEETLRSPDYIKVASTLSDIESFDAEFFGLSPREAEIMDPQHRLFLECAWQALEHAGYDALGYTGAIGLYAGTAISNYLFHNVLSNRHAIESMGDRHVLMVNDKDFLCGRVSFELNLRGPSVVVQTACSTSLVAVHMACQSVLSGECDMALAGGVSIQVLEKRGYQYHEGGLQSADGHCRAFDANATGIVSGNGAGLVVLKSLAAARADGDTIHAIIRGSAINNDGRDKSSFTAPSVDGQAAVIREAQAVAGIDADSISYIEAHGTGTMLGDPIEMTALKQAFAETTKRRQFCAVGSLKTNLGHLDIAAGVAGLIKTVLALKHRELPPSLHYTAPNPHIDFANSPFFVNAERRPWASPDSPRRAGVSSFGIGGTNAHVIVEEALPIASAPSLSPAHLLVLSARTPTALDAAAANLAAHLERHPDANIADVAYTLQQGRRHFDLRRSVSCVDVADAIERLRIPAEQQRVIRAPDDSGPAVVFMFPGGGTQSIGMARALYESEAVFRDVFDECAETVLPVLGHDLRELLFIEHVDAAAAAALLDQTGVALPALFAVEYSLAKQFNAWGVDAAAMVGHSLGEYVAACLAGVFTLTDALRVVTERGRLIQSLPTGNMLAVLQSVAEITPRLGDGLWLACENTHGACTIAGTPEATERLADELKADGIDFQLLRGWPGSHSGLMEPILEPFRAVLDTVSLSAPTRPYLSNTTGTWITVAQATDPAYWVSHLRQTVRFADCLQVLLANPAHVYLELGPGHTLSNLLRREVGLGTPVAAISSLPRRDSSDCSLLAAMQALGNLWGYGCPLDFELFADGELRRRVPLPTYPFERKRYWLENRDVAQWADGHGRDGHRGDDHQDDARSERTAGEGSAVHAGPSTAPLSRHARPALPTPFVAPSSESEQALAVIWENLLGVSPVGIDDNFFQLGGSSLIAIQLASRIRSAFDVDMPLRSLFETPNIAAQAVEIEGRRTRSSGEASAVIQPRPAGQLIPLSFAQQRLWFVDQLDHASTVAFHIPFAMRLSGRLDTDALQRTLDRVVARHESQRTCFVTVDGQTVQVIEPADIGFPLDCIDLGGRSADEQEIAIAEHCAAEFSQLFDLVAGPLSRGRLLRLADDEHILLITQHHIISDGWSIGLLIQEVMALYGAFSRGLPDPLPPLRLQYGDYAVWQRSWLQGDVLAAQTSFWKDYLAGAPELLSLPTDRPRPARQGFDGAAVPFALSAELSAGLRALSERHGTTLFMTLLAGWSISLARLSGQHDIVVGTPVANRQRSEIESLIGFFVNTLPLRVSIDGGARVGELLAQVQASTLRAYEHQDLPFEQIVEAVQPARSMSHSPLFQVMLNIHATPSFSELSLPGLTLGEVGQDQPTAQYDLLLSISHTDGDGQIAGDLRYATSLFDAETVTRMVELLQRTLSAMVADDARRIGELPLLGDIERQRLLVEFNDTAHRFDGGDLLHGLFEAQAAARPEAIALAHGDVTVSYTELNRRANRLAHRLIALGVKPDSRVAISVDRGIDMVVGLLGILKAGGAYVPLDPSYPAERLAHMLADSAPLALLTQAALAAELPPSLGLPVVVLDDAAELAGLETLPDANPDAAALGLHGGHLAYVIYTSGSTGTPKGVMNEHRGLCNLAHAQIDAFGVRSDSRVLQFASFSFDASISEIAMALCAGATLQLADRAALWPGEPLLRTLAERAVTHVTLPPAALAVMSDSEQLAPMTLIVAGDVCPPALAQQWSQRHRLLNAYGPTEVTVCASIGEVTAADSAAATSISIGHPIANAQVYILDAQQQLAPLGAIGELVVGGAGIARGYLNLPGLTAERFIDDPFSGRPGARLYRTGDLARWRDDGRLEFLGRNDAQVKIRGFRVEPGEIEVRLAACDGVREAVVIAREDQPGDKRLVAYLTARDGATLSSAQLRASLSQHLAEYMIPAAFVVLDQLPLTPNGKVDRRALPLPDGDAVAARCFEAPQGPTEQQLARLWQELLGLSRVGRHDNFFELGGHSLLAVQLLARLHEGQGITLPLSKVFEAPTLASLAEAVIEIELAQFDLQDIELAAADIDGMSDEEVEQWLAREQQSLKP